MRHFLTLKDYSKEEILEIIALSNEIKREMKSGVFKPYMANKTLGMIFEKSSTRTRVSFEVGIYQLGGIGLFLSNRDLQIGRGEPIKDSARVISRMVDMVMIRTYSQSIIEEFASYSKVPVINGLTDEYHPVQIMADLMTMFEHGKSLESKIAWIGDGNNMTSSWLMLVSKLGMEIRVATPKGYEVPQNIIDDAMNFANESGAKIIFTNDPKEAATKADVINTDTWVSMGQDEEKERRKRDFKGFIVDSSIMKLANKDAIFMHCLPAYRGDEVSEEVLEGSQSVVFDEAENRLHVQKGIMVWLDRKRD
ncbi:MAG: ornithine carbamoyltransferase [Campylobacterales bacterium]|nr:ornithine carbamoyltransferase [Campylobacterales bacterium]